MSDLERGTISFFDRIFIVGGQSSSLSYGYFRPARKCLLVFLRSSLAFFKFASFKFYVCLFAKGQIPTMFPCQSQ